MKIKFKIKRGGVFRQLAAVFLPMAVISLCSCSQEEPVASVQEPTSENIENPVLPRKLWLSLNGRGRSFMEVMPQLPVHLLLR